MESRERPRTKRLERPTPNLNHPIISNKKSNEKNIHLEQCIEVISKCQITSSTNPSNKLKANPKPTVQKNRQNNRQKSSESKLKFNELKDVKEVSLQEFVKNEQKFESIPKESTQKKIEINYSQINSVNIKDNNKTNEIEESFCSIGDTLNDKNDKTSERVDSDWSGWQQFNSQLMPCPHCYRTFFPHRLPVHEKCCKGISVKRVTAKGPDSLKISPFPSSVSNDCITCGRNYRTTSLRSHQLICNERKTLISGNNEINKIVAESRTKNRLLADRNNYQKSLSNKFQKRSMSSEDPNLFSLNKKLIQK